MWKKCKVNKNLSRNARKKFNKKIRKNVLVLAYNKEIKRILI